MISQLAFTSTCRPTSTKHRYLWRGCRLWHDGSLIPQERDHRWIALASKAYGISAICLLLYVDYGRDSTLLATLIHVSRKVRQVVHSENSNLLECVGPLTQLDIRHTLPGLQHGLLCALERVGGRSKEARGSFHACLYSPVLNLLSGTTPFLPTVST